MKVSSLKLGNIQVKNNIFLAPMAGYTDYPLRHISIKSGYGLVFTELVSAKGIVYGAKGNSELLYSGEDYENTAAQIFGSDGYYMRKACESKELENYKIIDINMGCPVPKVYKNGEGSALLNDIKRAENVVKECVKSGKVITVKIRTGLKKGDDVASEFAKMAESSGASLITIHGRVREAYYSGEVDYKAIEKAKKSVNIPVIANGGIFTVKDVEDMMENTGADGIMIARGALSDPFLISALLGEKPQCCLKEFVIEHVRQREKFVSGKRSAVEFRKFIPYYFKGINGIKDLKIALNKAETNEEIISLIKDNL